MPVSSSGAVSEMKTSRNCSAIVAALVLAAHSPGVLAGPNVWTTSGPDAVVNRVVASPQDATRLYAGAEDGLYQKDGEGQAWRNLGDPLLGRRTEACHVDVDPLTVALDVGANMFWKLLRQSSGELIQ